MPQRLSVSSRWQIATKRIVVCCVCLGLSFLAIAGFGLLQKTQAAENNLPEDQAGAGLVTLRGNTHPEAKPMNDRGRVSDDLPFPHMMLQLQRTPEQEEALQQFINDIHDPTSPLFHHWITAEEFGQRYGVPSAGISQITGWLESQGFKVNLVYPNQMVIDFSGSAGQIRQAFHTEIHNLLVKGQAHIANMSDPQIPVELASMVAGIVSLNDFRPRPAHEPRANYLAGYGYQLVVPADLTTIYNFNPAFAAGYSGQGQTIVLLEDTDLYTEEDWYVFRSTFGLASAYPAASLTQVHPSSSANNCTDPGVNGDDDEAAIDVEWASAGAPSAAIELASCSEGLFVPLQNLLNASSKPPAIVSISYGYSEPYMGASYNTYVSSMYQQAVTEGVSIFVSSGDWGAVISGDESGITVSGFTSTPYNVSVGGTDFADTYEGTNATYWNSTNAANYGSALSYVPEIPWNNSCASVLIGDYLGILPPYGAGGLCNQGEYLDYIAGSGGPSACATGAPVIGGVVGGTCAGYAKPSWQSGLIGNPSDGVRDIPDVSLFAANGIWDHYYVVCLSDPDYGRGCSGAPNTWPGFGGTSISSPIMASIQALVNQASGTRWGNPNPAYYAQAATEYGSGGNASCNSALGNTAAASCIFYDVTPIPLLYTGTGTGGDNNVLCSGDNCYRPSGAFGVLSTAPQTLSSVFVTNLGSGYTGAPTCTLSGGGGSGATCKGSKTGVVTAVSLTNGGSGYNPYAGEPVCTLTGGGGTGATCGANVNCNGEDCEVAGLYLTSFGSGYTSAPACHITRGYGGGATCTASVGPGIAVSLTAHGSGYTTLPQCTLSGGGGTDGTCAALAANTSDAYQPAFRAATGWDFATGIGTVNATNLVSALVSSSATLSSHSLTFSSQNVDTTSAAQSVTVTNTGTSALAFVSVTISGANSSDFAKSADTCTGAKLIAKGACKVSVKFTPSATGIRTASLIFTDIAPNNPQTVSLKGTGVNPVPTLSKLSPSSATAGGAAFTLTVTGTNFVSTSTIQWNGTGLTTTYVSGTKLTASVAASNIATAGKASVTVVNPTPGGGTSNGLTFTIN
jgi:subtilase family serine protease